MIHSILVICTGNICRSPMAAGLLQRALPGYAVSSAGLAPPVGAPADPRAALLLAREGCDLAGHRARAVDNSLVNAADLVLVMDYDQRTEMARQFPHARGKIYRIGEFIQVDVPDPYGCSQNMFSIVLELIKLGIASWLTQLETTEAATSHGDAS
ncbi:low molecular weight protein-tyrosine-phosphatase [Cupriavidus numazuensis]|uniref:protein-tyrosine-phosphatase n=1 Tax=Cupriavidus numazuensis TaxID=221992 RepID=A0ABM8TF65_9BURK|nr:low molecular weight protein-tyrosine-phosphatase [Cupriavidus numazuensis]CAG2141874.1 Low molecular weight protein-tyrosine-phosphatase Ptp [Cupriavidus numazuensis]